MPLNCDESYCNVFHSVEMIKGSYRSCSSFLREENRFDLCTDVIARYCNNLRSPAGYTSVIEHRILRYIFNREENVPSGEEGRKEKKGV